MLTARISNWSWLRSCGFAFAFFLIQQCTQAQTTLTGAVQFTTDGYGNFSNMGYENTLGGDFSYNLWLALNPDGSAPVNGPSDEQAGISIPLEAGKTYKYYTFAYPGGNTGFTGINLFFDGNNATPGISAFGPINDVFFFPSSGSTTETLQVTTVPGSGTTFYSSGGVVAVLTGFRWNLPASVPGRVCQPYEFSPGEEDVYSGSFSLQVFPEASLSLGQTSGSPLTTITMDGTGFAPEETISIFAGSLDSSPIANATGSSDGSFSASIQEPQHDYGSLNLFALGRTSGKLGAANLSVTPVLKINPESVQPGGTTMVQGVGFGADEIVSVYLDEPRVLLGTVKANVVGSFINSTHSTPLQVTIPTTAMPGINALIGIGGTTAAVGIGQITVE